MNYQILAEILGALFALSEALGGIKSVASNSVYQLVKRAVVIAYQTLTGKTEAPKVS